MAKIDDIRHRTQRTNGTRPESAINAIARHHSATPTGNFDTFWAFWNGSRGWGTGGYAEIILRDGTVQICYNPTEITNGIGNHNANTYHICVVGNGSFTEAQEVAWRERALVAMKRFNLPVSAVKGHNEFSGTSTACPGINMNTVRKQLLNNTPVEVVQVSNSISAAHVVTAGQTLGAIATANNISVDSIVKANNITDPNLIRVGQRLIIPGGSSVEVKPVVKPAPTPQPSTVKPTESIVQYLQSRNQPSSFAARQKLAPQYGISGYTGTAAQNTLLLDRMRANWKPATKEYVQLPASASTWRTYRLNVSPVAANSDWSLTPAKFGGLEYEVLGKPQANIVTINTSRGRRNIFVGAGTGAKIVRK